MSDDIACSAERPIDCGHCSLAWPTLHVGHNTNHADLRWILRTLETESLVERISPREELSEECLIDDRHNRVAGPIVGPNSVAPSKSRPDSSAERIVSKKCGATELNATNDE
jgi:hypothetical protein